MIRYLMIGLVALAASAATPAWAKNYALLIGNAAYSLGPLDNPVNDANDFAKTLREIGFDARVITNQNKEAMMQAIRDFGERIKGNDGIALFYYAGHGVQVEGENYLLPVNESIRNEEEVKKNAVPANLVLRYMEDSKNRVNVVVLDACRNNPFLKTRSLKSRGLAPMDAPSGSLIAFSTAPGTEALDGSDRNGLYTKHLMANVKVPGLTVEQVFKRTREAVEIESERLAGRRQSPREESSLKGGDMYFVPPPAGKQTDDAAIELAYWNSIANSDSSADFESYLAQYPNGRFAELAKNRLQAMKSRQTLARSETRTADGGQTAAPAASAAPTPAFGQPPAAPTRLAAARPGGVYGSARKFSFSDDEGQATVKAAEFLSIGCRDMIRNKKVALQLDDRSGGGEVVRQSLEAKLKSIGVKLAANKAGADFVVRGKITAASGINRLVGINEVDLTADFTLLLKNGNAVASTSAYGSSFSGANRQQTVRALWDEKSEEVVGRLFGDYCSD
ncbi:caspase family protein [Sulfuricystis multivorans]|uniref:caspase family protein n=1 Tax=Sulfuricystis multivorans TaxID=2211108 RepID=UPI000F831B80|nr:caspase family protein [Sulfuricystis multivorans]